MKALKDILFGIVLLFLFWLPAPPRRRDEHEEAGV